MPREIAADVGRKGSLRCSRGWIRALRTHLSFSLPRIHLSKVLRSLAVIVAQHPSQSFPAVDVAFGSANLLAGSDNAAAQSLMVSFPVIMRGELCECFAQGILTVEDHAIETLGFHTAYEALDVRVQIGNLGRQHNRFRIHSLKHTAKRKELRVAVHQDIPCVQEKAIVTVGQVSAHLLHPGSVRIGSDACNLDPAVGHSHRHQNIERHQAATRPHFNGREIHCRQYIPVGLEKRLPSRLPSTLGRRINPMLPENVPDRGIAERDAQWDKAIELYRRARDVIESQRRSVRTETSKIGFTNDKQAAYHGIVRVALKLGRKALAVETAEQAKSRTLVDILASDGHDTRRRKPLLSGARSLLLQAPHAAQHQDFCGARALLEDRPVVQHLP